MHMHGWLNRVVVRAGEISHRSEAGPRLLGSLNSARCLPVLLTRYEIGMGMGMDMIGRDWTEQGTGTGNTSGTRRPCQRTTDNG